MARGILAWVGLAASLAIAAHVGLYGLEAFVRGDAWVGVAFGLLAVAIVAIEEYVTRPTDLPGTAVGKVVGAVTKEPEEE